MNRRLVILEVVAKPLYVVILAASLVVLLRGHNEPGGGFIGGLLAGGARGLWGRAPRPPALFSVGPPAGAGLNSVEDLFDETGLPR